jgi:uncharacterized protein YrrD
MLILSQRLLTQPIVSIQTGGRLGRVSSAIIDPRQLKVVAFRCTGPLLNAGDTILHSEDIREVSSIGLIVDSADDIMPTDDLVRLKEVIGFDFKLEDKLVVEESGHKVGRVTEYSMETGSFYIIKLHVKPGFFGSFGTTEKIIDRSQIVEITPQKITVRSATAKDESPAEEKAAPVVENPFRRTMAQPDSAATNQE